MRIFKLRSFARWMKQEDLKDEVLNTAILEIEQGLVDANLGSGLYKKRISSNSKGKRGGNRVLLAYKIDQRAIFLFGFAKNEKDNIEDNQLAILKKMSKDYLLLSEKSIAELITKNFFYEVF